MFCSKRRKKVLLFFCLITLLFIIFKGDLFLCSPWEQLTVRTWEPFDEYLFCTEGKQRIPACMLNITKQLKGRLIVDTNINEYAIVHDHHKDIQPGGMWEPSTCVSCYHVAIIVPYRDRYNHLKILLHFLIPLLQRQHIKFRIFVVEQKGNKLFNRGRMMNVGFKEAMKLGDFDCFIFHDVDLIPEDDRNIYTCSSQPRHMSVAIDKFKYELPYYCIVGGVLSFRREHFQKVNGYSNMYWGWGAEDDDMYRRLKQVDLALMRPSIHVGRYKMIRHDQQEVLPSNWRFTLLATAKKRFHRDGLSSLDYHVTLMNNTQLFTHIVVDIGQPPPDLLN